MSLPAVAVSQSPENKFREYLASRPRPQRFTDQQRDMVRYIFSQHNHFDADQLIDAVNATTSRSAGPRSTARSASSWTPACCRLAMCGSRTFYEHDYGYPQHEHLYCQQCSQMIEFQHPAIVAIIDEVCRQQGFRSAGHSLIVRGICADCNRARVTKRRLDLV